LHKNAAGWALVIGVGILATTSPAAGQAGSYLGPGVLSRGAGTVGSRAGQQVDLRFGASVSGFYDNGLVPIVTDEKGELLKPGGQYGVEASLFAYGSHQWRRSQLGLEYSGNYRYYTNSQYYNGSDQMLVLGFTHQQSQRLVFDFREVAGTLGRQNSGILGNIAALPTDAFDPNTSLLFDNRATFLQTGMDVSYLLSPRTSIRVGGQGYLVERQSKALIGVQGYTLSGALQHRVSRDTTIGVNFDHVHYDFPRAFGESDINSFQGMWARGLGRYWTISLQGGVFLVEAQGLQRVQLEPAVAAILGVSTGIQAFYKKSTFPVVNAAISRRFKSAILSFDYARSYNPGNGVYLTSRSEGADVNFTYSGVRKWSFSAAGGATSMSGIGQQTTSYRQATAGVGATRSLTRSLYVIARVDGRHQDLGVSSFRRNSYRVSIGLSFSPGDLPLTLW
jgi:hypothetical protein